MGHKDIKLVLTVTVPTGRGNAGKDDNAPAWKSSGMISCQNEMKS